MQQIKPSIYYEDSYLGVTLGALVFSHGAIMIDAPLRAEDSRSWRAALLNLRGGPNRLLISLDAHLDRTLGVRAMEVTVISHQMTAQIFRNRPMIFKGQGMDSGSEWEAYDDAIGTRWASPDITFSDRMMLNWGGPQVVLEHHPGPAMGAIWVVVPSERVVFIGDAVTPDQPPFLALADLPVWIETLDVLLKGFRDYLIISGRNGLVGVDAIRAQQRFLKNIHRGMERLVKRNASAEATATLAQNLLNEISFPAKYQEQYAQRLRAGMFQYYTRYYQQSAPLDHIGFEEAES